MANKLMILLLVVAALGSLFFLGASMTGYFVKSVEYEDICSADSDCPENQCCVIYQEENMGLCMESCQSVEFLCTPDSECEMGTVCCISEGMKYGICNEIDKCKSIDIFAEYATKKARLEMPASVQDIRDVVIIAESLVIVALIGMIMWLVSRKNER